MRHCYLLTSVIILAVSGCAPPTRRELEQELEALRLREMSPDEASQALESAGFRCKIHNPVNGHPAEIECDRSLQHRFIATCIERVFMTVKSDNSKVDLLQVVEPVCASL